MSETYAVSETGTYTEARAVAVFKLQDSEEFAKYAAARKISYDTAQKWADDLLYLAKAKVLRYFEIQCSINGNKFRGYKYILSDDGSLQENSQSGGIDLYNLPAECVVGLFADVDFTKPNSQEVSSYLASQGWGTSGSSLGGSATYERAFSKNGYGVKRYRIDL